MSERRNDVIGFEPTNLDGFIDPVDLDALTSVYEELARYATHKAKVMRLRERGYIQAALEHESKCEDIYRVLPEWARW